MAPVLGLLRDQWVARLTVTAVVSVVLLAGGAILDSYTTEAPRTDNTLVYGAGEVFTVANGVFAGSITTNATLEVPVLSGNLTAWTRELPGRVHFIDGTIRSGFVGHLTHNSSGSTLSSELSSDGPELRLNGTIVELARLQNQTPQNTTWSMRDGTVGGFDGIGKSLPGTRLPHILAVSLFPLVGLGLVVSRMTAPRIIRLLFVIAVVDVALFAAALLYTDATLSGIQGVAGGYHASSLVARGALFLGVVGLGVPALCLTGSSFLRRLRRKGVDEQSPEILAALNTQDSIMALSFVWVSIAQHGLSAWGILGRGSSDPLTAFILIGETTRFGILLLLAAFAWATYGTSLWAMSCWGRRRHPDAVTGGARANQRLIPAFDALLDAWKAWSLVAIATVFAGFLWGSTVRQVVLLGVVILALAGVIWLLQQAYRAKLGTGFYSEGTIRENLRYTREQLTWLTSVVLGALVGAELVFRVGERLTRPLALGFPSPETGLKPIQFSVLSPSDPIIIGMVVAATAVLSLAWIYMWLLPSVRAIGGQRGSLILLQIVPLTFIVNIVTGVAATWPEIALGALDPAQLFRSALLGTVIAVFGADLYAKADGG